MRLLRLLCLLRLLHLLRLLSLPHLLMVKIWVLHSVGRYYQTVVLLRDMNARVGAEFASGPECMRIFLVGKINRNSKRLLELCSISSLCMTNTMFPGQSHKKMLWCHSRSTIWHQLDFVINSQRHWQEVLGTRTYRNATVTLLTVLLSHLWDFTEIKKKIDINKVNALELKEKVCDRPEKKLANVQQDVAQMHARTVWKVPSTRRH